MSFEVLSSKVKLNLGVKLNRSIILSKEPSKECIMSRTLCGNLYARIAGCRLCNCKEAINALLTKV